MAAVFWRTRLKSCLQLYETLQKTLHVDQRSTFHRWTFVTFNAMHLNSSSNIREYFTVRQVGPCLMHVRWKHGKGKKSASNQDDDEESDSDEDELSEDEGGDFGPHHEDDVSLPNNYAEIRKHVKSLRIDGIVSAGLNVARNKVDDYFLSSKLLLNGEKVLKKSKQMKVGDCVDLISEMLADEDKMKIKRIRVVKLDQRETSKGKMMVYLRCWRGNVVVDNPNAWRPHS